MNTPSKIIHYYSGLDHPLQNLCDLEPSALAVVISRLNRRKAEQPAFKRVFGSAYMEFRRRTEAKMRALFVRRGGKPERLSPHYFVLGECPWFAGLYPDTGAIELDWRSLPDGLVSFTYPDSFIAMRFGPDYGLPEEPLQPYHDQVFLPDEIEQVVSTYGLPDGSAGEAMKAIRRVGSKSTSRLKSGLTSRWRPIFGYDTFKRELDLTPPMLRGRTAARD